MEAGDEKVMPLFLVEESPIVVVVLGLYEANLRDPGAHYQLRRERYEEEEDEEWSENGWVSFPNIFCQP